VQVANLISLAALARKADVPDSQLRERVASGELQPDATARNGKRMFIYFAPERAAQLALSLKSKPVAA